MKKLLLALLAVMMVFAFCACGDTQEQTGLDGSDKDITTLSGPADAASDSNLTVNNDEPRYTSDGELIVEKEYPASDGNLSE